MRGSSVWTIVTMCTLLTTNQAVAQEPTEPNEDLVNSSKPPSPEAYQPTRNVVAKQNKKEAPPFTPPTDPLSFYISDPDTSPRQRRDHTDICIATSRGFPLRMQCDEDTKTCYVSTYVLWKKDDKGVLTFYSRSGVAKSSRCTTKKQRYEAFRHEYIAKGYTFKNAIMEAPYGYQREQNNMITQTHFDLRTRFYTGVYYAGTHPIEGLPSGWNNGLVLELGGAIEFNNYENTRRHRIGLLQGQYQPGRRLSAVAFDYEYGRDEDDPLLWITTFWGEPERYDLTLNIGSGLKVAQFEHWYVKDGPDEGFLDIAEGRLQWELLQGVGLEDVLLVYVSGGVGIRPLQEMVSQSTYAYPEVGVRGAWLVGPQGLLDLRAEASIRQGYQFNGDASWRAAKASGSVEMMPLAISDQPLTLFLSPEFHMVQMDDSTRREPTNNLKEVRVMAGVRMSFGVDTPSETLHKKEGFDTDAGAWQ